MANDEVNNNNAGSDNVAVNDRAESQNIGFDSNQYQQGATDSAAQQRSEDTERMVQNNTLPSLELSDSTDSKQKGDGSSSSGKSSDKPEEQKYSGSTEQQKESELAKVGEDQSNKYQYKNLEDSKDVGDQQKDGTDQQKDGTDQQKDGTDQQKDGTDQQKDGTDQQKDGTDKEKDDNDQASKSKHDSKEEHGIDNGENDSKDSEGKDKDNSNSAEDKGETITGTYQATGSGYTKENNATEGGPLDMKDKEINTLQDYLKGEAPYVSVAMDNKAGIPYGQDVRIPELNQKYGKDIPFKVVDTGEDFYGKGHSRIDIATANQKEAHDDAINGPLTLQFVNKKR